MESFLQNHHYSFPAIPNVNSFEIRKFLNKCTCTYSWAKEKISSQNPEFITWITPACFSMMVLLQLYRQWKGRCRWINSGLSGTLLTCKYNNPRQRNWRWMNYQCGPIISKCINFLHYFLSFFFKVFWAPESHHQTIRLQVTKFWVHSLEELCNLAFCSISE